MKLLTPDTSAISSFEERGKFLMAWRLSILFILIFTALSFAFRPISAKSAIVYVSVLALAFIILIYLHTTKKSRLAFWIYAVSGSIIAQITLNTILDSAHFGDFLWVISSIVFAFVSLGRIAGLAFTAFHLLGIGYYLTFSINQHFDEVRYHYAGDKLALFAELLLGFVTIAYLLNQYVVFQNYSKKQLITLNDSLEDQNEAVLQKNKENITLVKEVHHRVKNNLQIIISLLRMQRSQIESTEARRHFSVSINRILTMSMIHQKLYQEKEPSKINIHDYLKDLTSELMILSEEQVSVRVNLEAREEFADLKTIVPLGLLINELFANSMKHAFGDKKEGEIHIRLTRDEQNGVMLLEYADSGIWQQSDTEMGFGLELIEILTEQMEGKYERNESTYTFEIPLDA